MLACQRLKRIRDREKKNSTKAKTGIKASLPSSSLQVQILLDREVESYTCR